MNKRVKFLLTSRQRSQGAMGKKSLGDEILAFVYPTPAPRIYFTFLCSPLRIVAIDIKQRKAIFDKVVQPSRFVVLPPTSLVLEMDEGMDYSDVLDDIFEGIKPGVRRAMAGVDPSISVDNLLFGLFADALCEMRRVKTICLDRHGNVNPTVLQQRLEPWERGKIVGAAGFVMDFSPMVEWRIPDRAVYLSSQVVEIEKDYHDELIAASVAGVPWQKDFSCSCFRCGRNASWRFVLPIPNDMPDEIAWRLQRPENAIPICRVCNGSIHFSERGDVRRKLALSLWGRRFTALEMWHLAVQGLGGYRLPKDWDRELYPLWPKEFGGLDWCSGSGAAKFCEPREPSKLKSIEHQSRIAARKMQTT